MDGGNTPGNFVPDNLYMTLSSIAEGVISTDVNRNILFMNRAAGRLTGWQEGDAVGSPLDSVLKLVDAKTREKVDCSFPRVWADGKQESIGDYMKVISKSGSERYAAVTASPCKREDGTVYGMVLTLRDVTSYKEMEEELRTERNNLRTQFQYAPAGMVIVDENQIIQSVNDHFIDIVKKQVDRIVGSKLCETLGCIGDIKGLTSDEECGRCLIGGCIRKVLDSRIPFRNLEKRFRLLHQEGMDFRNLKLDLVPICINGRTNVLIAVEDMTEFRSMETNLRKSRDFYLTLFEDFPALIWRTNTDRKIDYVNKKWVEFTGSTCNEELSCIWEKNLHPEDLERCIGIFETAFNRHESYEMEYRLRRYDGEYRWMIDRAGPHYDLEGNFAGYIGTSHDITEQKKAANVLKRYELLSEKARDIILFFNRNGDIVEANEAAVKTYGYSREELLTMSLFDLRADGKHAKAQLDKAFLDGNFFQTLHYRKDGSILPVEVSTQSAVLEEGAVVISIIRDITERKQVELEMRRAMDATKAAYKAKSEFLANMSHEIRTPLNGIIGMLDLTMLTELSEDQLDNLSTAKTCANSLLKIINDVLDFSKMEAGRLTIEHVRFDFMALVDKIIKVHDYQAREKGIALTSDISADLPGLLVGDPNRLQQVLNNLLSNAVKFTDSGYVNLEVKVVNRMEDFVKLQFSVEDTGIGISENEMDKLFKSFSQIDGSQTRRFGGTGLGLVISRQLIEMMGGTLRLESEKGKGSTFSFSLNFEIGEFNRTETEHAERFAVGKTKRDACILLVEDDKVNQVVISRMLKEMGYRTDVAGSGQEALNLLEHKEYDLCLMDIQMPGLDGVQTAGIIRQNENKKGKYMPIAAITAHALQGDRERFMTIGMDEYIAKPFQMEDLFDLLEKVLSGDSAKKGHMTDDLSEGHSIDNFQINSYIKSYVNEINPIVYKIRCETERLKSAIIAEDIQEIELISHAVKALAASICADRLKTLAFRIELAARRGNLAEAAELYIELKNEFDQYSISVSKMEDSI